jgi:S1-C subfamily serine protease
MSAASLRLVGRCAIAALVLLTGSTLAVDSSPLPAGNLAPVFSNVRATVVVVRTTERAAVLRSNGRQVRIDGIGSGVLVSPDGNVMTAAHVVQTADTILVEFADQDPVPAEIIASEPAADVALLKVQRVPDGVKPARLGDSDKAQIGEQVFVVGAPLGITHTLTVGHLSARHRPKATFSGVLTAEFFQTDAAINPGNSGGPMFNLQGEVIGIVSYILSQSGGWDGIGFAVTSNTTRRLLLDEPSVWSGLDAYLLSGEAARAFNLPVGFEAGLLVQRVALGSLADRLGVRGGTLTAAFQDDELLLGGDVILAVEGIAIGGRDAYESIRQRMIELRAARATVHLTLLRGGRTLELAGALTH